MSDIEAIDKDLHQSNTQDEEKLLYASYVKDVETLTSLLRKGICPNVYSYQMR